MLLTNKQRNKQTNKSRENNIPSPNRGRGNKAIIKDPITPHNFSALPYEISVFKMTSISQGSVAIVWLLIILLQIYC